MRITSTANPRIKAAAALKERRAREKTGLFLIEGAREIGRALQAGLDFVEAYRGERLSPEEARLAAALEPRLPLILASEAVLKKLSNRENPAGLVALARIPKATLAGYTPPKNALVLLAVGIEKPGNLGAILRSAEAAGASAVLVVGGTDLYNPQVVHNSTGAVFSLPCFSVDEEEAWGWLERHQIPLVATTPHAEKTYWEAELRGAVALALGPEHEGLGPAWLARAASRIRVPMWGQADSLNVSVTAALVLYEAARQRNLR
ncbi:MAG: RNA methyltransferase [Meiothermus sp.]|uniref:TrmH family RNA methyltransferase n=1 Tax=Meiothermus sp. TaxID=1955249 RepID=UPI0025EA7B3D|nr:RNA methyltransferase [Meiothermus sp.]MCS7058320.1 RNA methyltransferase [Meiothermus sp.]MCS7194819.1 RNA methyltransferase [Meiothermus sp.]MCX7741289.1 RNA methyltransferase [Meiothermus sp.]MDW8090351.1 RNA methyltransferase [Meiothermus sp.]MDW8481150.1 RNA methyltransferase [Meiothermus sp.]